jgi:hypothetical protein
VRLPGREKRDGLRRPRRDPEIASVALEPDDHRRRRHAADRPAPGHRHLPREHRAPVAGLPGPAARAAGVRGLKGAGATDRRPANPGGPRPIAMSTMNSP